MTNSDGLLRARWRRLNARLKEVRSSVGSGDQDRLPDAVSGALDAMNEMWVYWCGKKTLGTLKDQDNFVRGDVEGETAAALVHARGAKTHDPEEFGDLTDTYTDVYSDLYGVWRWQAYSRPDPNTRIVISGMASMLPIRRSCLHLTPQSGGCTVSLNSDETRASASFLGRAQRTTQRPPETPQAVGALVEAIG